MPDPLVAGEDRPDADIDRCQVDHGATDPVACTFGDPEGQVTVALVGDSKAMQWLPALQATAAREHWRIVTYGKSSCAFADARRPSPGAAYPECDAWNAAVMRALAARPAGRRRHLRSLTGGLGRARPRRRAPRAGLRRPLAALAGAGVPVVVVGNNPLSPDDLDVCAARHAEDLDACTVPAAPAVAVSGPPVQEMAVAAAGDPGCTLLDLTP